MGYVGTAPVVTFAGRDMARREGSRPGQPGGLGHQWCRNGLEADDVASLKGRTMAVPGYSTVQDFLLRIALEEAGVSAQDVNIITLKPPEMIPALAGSQVDAFVAWEPYPSRWSHRRRAASCFTSARIWPHHPCCMLVADSEFLRENPDTVRSGGGRPRQGHPVYKRQRARGGRHGAPVHRAATGRREHGDEAHRVLLPPRDRGRSSATSSSSTPRA